MVAATSTGRPLTAENNLGLVRREVRRFRWALGTVLDEADLMQAGALGLLRALDGYDHERGALSTYAAPYIRVAIQEAISHGRRVVRVPPKTESRMRREGTPPPLDALELDAPIGGDEGMTWRDMVRSDEDPTAALDRRELVEVICAAYEQLPERDRVLLRARFVDDLSLREVGERHGLSRERVRQIVEQACAQLASAVGDSP